MLFLSVITAAILAGTVGYALTPIIEDDDDSIYDGNDGELSNEDDNYVGSIGLDEIFGGDGDDLIAAEESVDVVEGGTGDDKLVGGAGADEVRGNEGDDVVSTGSGNDAGFGGAGDDTVQGGSGHDWLSGGDGDDFVKGDDGDDTLFGGQGLDVLRGGEGNDVLVGAEIFRDYEENRDGVNLSFEDTVLYDTDEDGMDLINGDDGADKLILGRGDIGRGGEGDDIFLTGIWAKGEPSIIDDFTPGEDQLYLAIEAGQPFPELTFQNIDGNEVVFADGEPVLVVIGAGDTLSDDSIIFTTEVFDTRPEEETAIAV